MQAQIVIVLRQNPEVLRNASTRRDLKANFQPWIRPLLK